MGPWPTQLNHQSVNASLSNPLKTNIHNLMYSTKMSKSPIPRVVFSIHNTYYNVRHSVFITDLWFCVELVFCIFETLIYFHHTWALVLSNEAHLWSK
jgi:hypothetical protein